MTCSNQWKCLDYFEKTETYKQKPNRETKTKVKPHQKKAYLLKMAAILNNQKVYVCIIHSFTES